MQMPLQITSGYEYRLVEFYSKFKSSRLQALIAFCAGLLKWLLRRSSAGRIPDAPRSRAGSFTYTHGTLLSSRLQLGNSDRPTGSLRPQPKASYHVVLFKPTLET